MSVFDVPVATNVCTDVGHISAPVVAAPFMGLHDSRPSNSSEQESFSGRQETPSNRLLLAPSALRRRLHADPRHLWGVAPEAAIRAVRQPGRGQPGCYRLCGEDSFGCADMVLVQNDRLPERRHPIERASGCSCGWCCGASRVRSDGELGRREGALQGP